MLSFLLSLINPISRIADKIAEYKIAAKNAETDKDRIAAEERSKALEARRDVMIAEASSRVNQWVRVGFAFPFIVYNAKLVLYDKVLSLGATDALSPELFQIELACLSFYFLNSMVDRIWRR